MKVKLFRQPMVMALCGAAGGNAGFGETLVLYRGVRAVENAPDRRTVGGGEGVLVGEVLDRHGKGFGFQV
jgi:hypothetical protein